MKHLLLLLCLFPLSLHAQLSPEALERIHQDAWHKGEGLRKELTAAGSGDYLSVLETGYTVDTFRVEEVMRRMMDQDYSTLGMTDAIMEAEKGYDKLLNQYYAQILKRFTPADQEVLRQSQRAWITWRDAERKLNITTAGEMYSGGGTIQQLFISSRYLAITKQRVQELYDYLYRMPQ